MKPKHFRFSVKKLEQAVKIEKGWNWGRLAFELSKASDSQVSEQRIHMWRKDIKPSEPVGNIVRLLAYITNKPMEYFYEEVKLKGAKA